MRIQKEGTFFFLIFDFWLIDNVWKNSSNTFVIFRVPLILIMALELYYITIKLTGKYTEVTVTCYNKEKDSDYEST